MADNTVNGADNKEVIEAVLTASEYCKKLERALGNVAFEFENGKADDTEDYAKSILEGVNWTIQVYNATKDYLKEIGFEVDQNAVNEAIKAIGKAYEDDDDNAKAELFKGELKNFIGAIALAGGRIN